MKGLTYKRLSVYIGKDVFDFYDVEMADSNTQEVRFRYNCGENGTMDIAIFYKPNIQGITTTS